MSMIEEFYSQEDMIEACQQETEDRNMEEMFYADIAREIDKLVGKYMYSSEEVYNIINDNKIDVNMKNTDEIAKEIVRVLNLK